MSNGVQSAGLFGSSSQTGSLSSYSLRGFADLDLTEAQRKQIRSVFRIAQSQGLSQAEIQQQIEAILTPAQQATLQSDIAATGSSSSNSNSAPQPPRSGNPFTDPNGPFANLNLTSDEQTQIATILQNAKSQGLTFDQINAQISAVLTTAQQATFATDLQNLPPPPTSQDPSSSGDSLSNLSLTDDQKSQIDTILQNAQENGTSQAGVLAQIEAVLTPGQTTAFFQDVQTAQAIVSGQSQDGSGGTGSSLTVTDIRNQIAAATTLILQQFQHEVGTST